MKNLWLIPVTGFVSIALKHYSHQENVRMASLLRAKHTAKFDGRTAVVVGATSGIGEGCALRLAEAGFKVTGQSTIVFQPHSPSFAQYHTSLSSLLPQH